MNAALLDRYVEATTRKHGLESDLRKVQDELNQIEPVLLEEFLQDGTQSVKNSAGATTYLHKQLWANAGELGQEAANRALIKAGLGDLVKLTFSTQSLSAWVREQETDKDGKPILPPSFEGAISVVEKVSVRVRGA